MPDALGFQANELRVHIDTIKSRMLIALGQTDNKNRAREERIQVLMFIMQEPINEKAKDFDQKARRLLRGISMFRGSVDEMSSDMRERVACNKEIEAKLKNEEEEKPIAALIEFLEKQMKKFSYGSRYHNYLQALKEAHEEMLKNSADENNPTAGQEMRTIKLS